MQRRFRFRRVLKWTGVFVCVLILLAGGACLRWRFFSYSNGKQAIVLGWGALIVGETEFVVPHELLVGPRWEGHSAGYFGGPWDWMEDEASLWSRALWPRRWSDPTGGGISVPLWLLLMVVFVPTAWLWRLDRCRARPGHCTCGYDLTGNTSGRCPECGAKTAARPTP